MKLVVVSNRLPITLSRSDSGFNYKHSSGGLVTGLQSINKRINFKWFGNLSSEGLSDEDKQVIYNDCTTKYNLYPIFVDPELNDNSYNGFCNGILWPMLHYFSDDLVVTEKYYEAYIEYNKVFLNEILKEVDDDDIVWVHDYHLLLLPKMIREIRKDIKIMFFLHTPFPNSISFNRLYCRKEILEGVLACNLISFHSYEYVGNFLECCDKNNLVCHSKVDSIPIGIDPEIFTNCLKEEKTIEKINFFKEKYKNKKILLGVDRSDYIKGIPNRVQGYTDFLKKFPEHIEDTVFLQIGVPSRTGVVEYKGYTECVNKLVADSNSKIGDIDNTNIYLQNDSVDFNTLCALYYISDILLITSLRDGMNLVAMEYVSCSYDKHGVLILSEFTGVTSTLPGSLGVNPWNIDEISEKIKEALEMSPEEREKRYNFNKENVYKFTSFKWAEDNLDMLDENWEKYIKK
ncbi:alpha-trehalose-phosphate synthase (TPS1) [Vairimorpha necatrix]|uniref:Alpha-trehalose-phosphate synthase (TPS1) n=1 Tax=Vairimorpha necatrix TaxID=6039 RepID=A0AAX4JCU0_9MICR